MLYRKVESKISDYFRSDKDKVLVVTEARQTGKSYIIRYCAQEVFKHVVEINLIEDYEGSRLFANNFGAEAVSSLRQMFQERKSVPEGLHGRVLDLYKRYLLVGGLPEAVNEFLASRDLNKVRYVQKYNFRTV